MRVSPERALTPPRPVTPAPPVGAVPGAVRARAIAFSPRAVRVALANALVGTAALIWLLPSPWGGLVPVALLAQLVWLRHGLPAAATGLVLGGGIGAAAGALAGMEDWRRASVALLLLLLPAMAAWPAAEGSARR